MDNRKLMALFLTLPYFLLLSDFLYGQEEDIQTRIFEEINILRKSGCQCGDELLPPVVELGWSHQLEEAAIYHATDMFKHSYFDHIGTDGSDLGDRVSAAGYQWSIIGENISWGYTSPSGVVQGWLESEGHCRNLMNPSFKQMGVARRGTFWVLDLGSGK